MGKNNCTCKKLNGVIINSRIDCPVKHRDTRKDCPCICHDGMEAVCGKCEHCIVKQDCVKGGRDSKDKYWDDSKQACSCHCHVDDTICGCCCGNCEREVNSCPHCTPVEEAKKDCCCGGACTNSKNYHICPNCQPEPKCEKRCQQHNKLIGEDACFTYRPTKPEECNCASKPRGYISTDCPAHCQRPKDSWEQALRIEAGKDKSVDGIFQDVDDLIQFIQTEITKIREEERRLITEEKDYRGKWYWKGYEEAKQQLKEELVKEVESLKKNTKDLFPDLIEIPDEAWAEACNKKDYYNEGIQKAIDLIKSKKEER